VFVFAAESAADRRGGDGTCSYPIGSDRAGDFIVFSAKRLTAPSAEAAWILDVLAQCHGDYGVCGQGDCSSCLICLVLWHRVDVSVW
jgi:hypothetical protein